MDSKFTVLPRLFRYFFYICKIVQVKYSKPLKHSNSRFKSAFIQHKLLFDFTETWYLIWYNGGVLRNNYLRVRFSVMLRLFNFVHISRSKLDNLIYANYTHRKMNKIRYGKFLWKNSRRVFKLFSYKHETSSHTILAVFQSLHLFCYK